jgi:purine-binding chemotaxis protein CheW
MSNSRQLCTFYLDQQLLGVDAEIVQEVIRYQAMTSVPRAPESVTGLINLRGQIVTAIDLRTRLGCTPRPAEKLPMNVVVRGDDGAVSLLVDQIGDVIEVSESQFELPPETLSDATRCLVKGAYKLDGALLLLLNWEVAIQVNSANN